MVHPSSWYCAVLSSIRSQVSWEYECAPSRCHEAARVCQDPPCACLSPTAPCGPPWVTHHAASLLTRASGAGGHPWHQSPSAPPASSKCNVAHEHALPRTPAYKQCHGRWECIHGLLALVAVLSVMAPHVNHLRLGGSRSVPPLKAHEQSANLQGSHCTALLHHEPSHLQLSSAAATAREHACTSHQAFGTYRRVASWGAR